MAHRAEQIVDAIRTLLDVESTLGVLYRHRRLPLDEGSTEIPATSVAIGEDSPLSEYGVANFSVIDSLLSLEVIHIASAATEDLVIDALMNMRVKSHTVLMNDRSQGLNFVIDTRYGGASAPEILDDGGKLAGRLSTLWTIHYRMTVSSPE